MPTPPATDPSPPPLTTAETAYLIRSLWEALLAPKWDASTRKDLQKLGEALYSGKTLKQLDNDLYDRLLPHLKIVATSLGRSLQKTAPTADAAPAAPREENPDHG